ncbi:caveolin-1-like [Haliotis rufescens]|uniref:caveolin-1-like n=1 Tax=Haliotis rufescens TaxID=6454 RepID=UPI001EAF9D14|nr:caveolin-1-like [Haliotis rufescens]
MDDILDRDPNNINEHVKVSFEDVLAEPDGSHSYSCVWSFSYLCFDCGKGCLYKLLTLLCGICIAMGWGCEFAWVTFTHIWFITPCFKVLELNCGCLQKIYGVCVHCAVGPCCEAFGLLFHAFRK